MEMTKERQPRMKESMLIECSQSEMEIGGKIASAELLGEQEVIETTGKAR
jgi:hypothetical protein